ncbi:hypothetical protein [Thiohalophilus thiocyanatoxydans]|uniref:Lipoprotein n=1 Tax=Thiohalophilus thiocyanatoxydans TaxID=381308 RepID=A0A4R8IG64_9GAMM|nr:hypothetical protein [Thiohalophilus thiocyanatoxydans]TDX98152.1 hypothetical protein EDC23_2634 [Thiohalophilus thiocyanatoxydans]
MARVVFFLILLISLSGCEQQEVPAEQIYPWQIELLPDGGSRVFGIEFNRTTLAEARKILGSHHDEGLFENRDGSMSLEIYFNEVTLGGISGKFILTLDADEAQLQALKERAGNSRTVDSGARRYRPSSADRELLYEMTISGLGYIPYVNLDEEMVHQRFGEPAEIMRIGEDKRHFLYPDKGLDLLLDGEGKELLQYVAPRDFERLQLPLLRQFDS